MPRHTPNPENILEFKPAVPVNETAERCALSCLLSNFAILDAYPWQESMFFYPAHKLIFEAIKKVKGQNAATDFFAVQAELERAGTLQAAGGSYGLTNVATTMPIGDVELARYHFNILAEVHQYREAHALAKESAEAFMRQEGSLGDYALKLASIASQATIKRESFSDQLNIFIDDLERPQPPERFGTGIPSIDNLDAGLGRGDLLTIGAQTSGGKSILLLQIALEAAKAGKSVLVFSLEMPAKKIISRFLSNMIGERVRGLAQGMTGAELAKIRVALGEIKKYDLTIESAVTDLDAIERAVRSSCANGKCDLVVVDYIQLVHLRELAKNETREQHVSEIVRRLKALALQLNVAVATASQLNEEGKLRESRAIGMHSDHVWIIRRSEDGDLLSMDKVRDGERGIAIPLLMRGAISRFDARIEK